jgi:hypothetical protein
MSDPKTEKSATPDSLTKSGKNAGIELSESELDQVAAGRKAGKGQQEYLKIELENTLITG